MTDSVALPRLRVKRRRRRPPTRREKMAMMILPIAVMAGVGGISITIYALSVAGPLILVLFPLQVPNLLTIVETWRVVHNYIVNGFEDDE